MEMDTGGLVAEQVVDFDDNGVTHRRLDLGARPFAIHTDDWPTEPIRGSPHPCDIPIVFDCSCLGQGCQGQEGERKNARRVHGYANPLNSQQKRVCVMER